MRSRAVGTGEGFTNGFNPGEAALSGRSTTPSRCSWKTSTRSTSHSGRMPPRHRGRKSSSGSCWSGIHPHRGPGAAGCDHRHHGRLGRSSMWWLRLACFNHKFFEGGFSDLERDRAGDGTGGDILNGLGHETQNDISPRCGSWARSSSRSGA